MSDKVVYDMSVYSESSTTIFAKKDWVSILDTANGNYGPNQCIIETSQISSSDKYANYREAYISAPLLLTLTSSFNGINDSGIKPNAAGTSCDFALGLKNWYGSIIHSISLDINGVTRVQQTPFQGLWNTFKLMSSLSYSDLLTQGPSIGFWPDTSTGVNFQNAFPALTNGMGECNNSNALGAPIVSGEYSSLGNCNEGFLRRQMMHAFDLAGLSDGANTVTFGTLVTAASLNQLYKSYIFNKRDCTATQAGVWQCAIMAQIKLRHLSDIFENLPLSKGLFFKLTMGLNQTSVTAQMTAANTLANFSVNSPNGGVNPIMFASLKAAVGTQGANGGAAAFGTFTAASTITASIAVGNTCLNSTQTSYGNGVARSPLATNVQLYVPMYTFASGMESAYISSPAKSFTYGDIFQYQILKVGAGQPFQQLVSNGITNIKRVLVLPYYSPDQNLDISPLLSPFTPAGGGPTSPFCHLSNFNVQISGQNVIYNTQNRAYEQYMNNYAGMFSANGGHIDGDTSGLVSELDFETCYCYYVVDCSRMNEVEKMIPKSVSVLGTNMSTKIVDLYVFVEYEQKCTIDVITGTSF